MRDLLAGKLPRQHHAADAKLCRLLHALERMDAHLRGCVDRHLRRDLAAECDHAQILHDERIDAQHRRRPDHLRRSRHLAVGDQRVERQVYLYAAHMAVDDGFLKLVHGKIPRAHACVEGVISKINRVGSVLHGGAQRLHGAGGR